MKKFNILFASAAIAALSFSGAALAADSSYDQDVTVKVLTPVTANTNAAVRAIESGVDLRTSAAGATGIANAKLVGVDDVRVNHDVYVEAVNGYTNANTNLNADYIKGGSEIVGSADGQLGGLANGSIELAFDGKTSIVTGAYGAQGSSTIEVVGDN